MENKSKKRILLGVLIVLIIMNLASLGAFSYHKYKNKPHFQEELEKKGSNKQKQHERVKYYVKRELQLSDEQFQEYCQLKDLNLKNSGEMWDKLTILRQATMLEITKENTDTARLNELSDSIGLYHKKMQQEMTRHFLSVKESLKPDQIKKFNEMILHIESGDWRKHGRNPESKDSIYHQNRQRVERE